jgi:hypothetical protein
MGIVDLALDERGQPVALKRLALYGSATEVASARRRVRREADALGRLRHPNVVPLLAVDDDGDDLVLVMPYLAGGTIGDQVRAYGPLSPEQVLGLAGPLLSALATAHDAGIVHRDLKPANVLFDLDGRPYLSDFGIARFRDATSGLTATGTVLGTADFMAPEQARGEPATPAADVFALGATLLFAATGRRPYGTADTRVALHRAANDQVEPLPADLDPRLAHLLRPMLRANPARRPTASTLAWELADRPRARSGRRRATAAVAVLLLIVAAIATGFLVRQATADQTAAPPTTAGSTTNASSVAGAPAPAPTSAPTTAPCHDLPYQPCGKPVAPFTDGHGCLQNHADYDGVEANGCEAAPDQIDGQRLDSSLTANLVPADDVDRYPFHVDDNFQWDCDGQVKVTLTAPAGVSMRLDVLNGTKVLGTAVSSNAKPATVTLDEPNCFTDDSADLVAQVKWEGSARSAANYKLERSGSF